MFKNVSAADAQALIGKGEVEIVDVRDAAEWNADGHIPGARLVPLDALRANTKASLPRDGVLFVCAAGVRSQVAARLAAQNGLKKVFSLSGGTRGWKGAGFAIVRDVALSA